jgi:hypothetical protein
MKNKLFFKNDNAKDIDSPASLKDLTTVPPTTPEQHRYLMRARVGRRRAIEDRKAHRILLSLW